MQVGDKMTQFYSLQMKNPTYDTYDYVNQLMLKIKKTKIGIAKLHKL